MKLYHITSREAWLDAARRGAYVAPSLAIEGFIHCSTAAQLYPVARRFYRGQNDLVLLLIDTDRLRAELRWEQAPASDDLDEEAVFPHVYGPIDMSAIVGTSDFDPDELGESGMPLMAREDRAPTARGAAG